MPQPLHSKRCISRVLCHRLVGQLELDVGRDFNMAAERGAARSDTTKRSRLYRSQTRGRSRDRSGSRDRGPSMQPAGPQTAMDWEEIADNLTRRVAQLEQRLQNVTQVVGGHTTTLEAYREGCAQLTVKLDNTETNINNLTERVTNLTGSAQFEVQGINDKLKLLEGMIQSLMQNSANTGGPANYNIGSPATDAPDEFATLYPRQTRQLVFGSRCQEDRRPEFL